MGKMKDLLGDAPYTPPSAREPYNGEPPYQKHSDTSKAAAASVSGVAPSLRERVFAMIAEKPSTMDEVEILTGLNAQSITPRFRELFLAGRIQDTGERRETRSTRKAAVWRAKA